jgi:hypothetical protein
MVVLEKPSANRQTSVRIAEPTNHLRLELKVFPVPNE